MNKKLIIIVSIVLVLAATAAVYLIFLKDGGGKGPVDLPGIDEIISVPDEEVALTFYFEAQEPDDTREILDYVESRAGKELNIKLDFEFLWEYPDAYLASLKQIIASGEPCDAFFYGGYMPVSLKTMAEENTIKDITGLFPTYAPNYYRQLSQEELSAASSEGRIYAIPQRYPRTEMRCAVVRQDLMDEYGIKDIRSYEDYEGFLKKVKETDPEMIPVAFYDTAIGLFAEANGYVILDYQMGLVYRWDDPEMKLQAWEQTPAFRKGIETLHRWHREGYLLENTGFTQVDEALATSGKWASFIGSLESEYNYNAMAGNKGKDFRYKSYRLYPGKPSARLSPMDGAFVIGGTSPNPERVLMFIDWLQSSQENYDTLMYGIKDRHYTLEGGKIKLPENTRPDSSLFSWPWRWPLCNISLERMESSSPVEALAEYRSIIDTESRYVPHTGFVPDYSQLGSSHVMRNMSFYSTEQKIFRGEYVESDIDDYISDLKEAGADELVFEIQKQLDEWRELNKKP